MVLTTDEYKVLAVSILSKDKTAWNSHPPVLQSIMIKSCMLGLVEMNILCSKERIVELKNDLIRIGIDKDSLND